MKIIDSFGKDDIARVYLAEIDNKYVEFVESVQPPTPREEKWVIIISTLYGCPVKCKFCDAGGNYFGKIRKEHLLEQIEFLVKNRFDNNIKTKRFKIQFARVGEPAFNSNVLAVLKELPDIYKAINIMPSISTIAPDGSENFFNELIDIKNNLYSNGNFQIQFSIHSTDKEQRNNLIPINKWSFEQISNFGDKYYRKHDRKITLNFALSNKSIIDENILIKHFSPEKFLIKITPINPTVNALKNNLQNAVYKNNSFIIKILEKLRTKKYNVILSIGELEENQIGSNCGQYIKHFIESNDLSIDSYQYIN